MIKKIQISLAFLGLLLFLVHGVIPHHHHDAHDIVNLISHPHHNQDNFKDDNPDHHIPLPAHQHLSVLENFDLVRLNTSAFKSIILQAYDIIYYSGCLYSVYPNEFHQKSFSYTIKGPLISLPFIISPNAMRGSPVMD